ncbi:MAG TPA: bi-domain-containing oxidoreductase [Solirubrobacteraceae bacterium]|jgi:predicted dehydrogenase/threonine dehydrogenase-like Zn-dependent dehydrogenase|nr:bi-domain-containing oxidoreductase [Solirubrobacteraceae bacterium]
MRQVVLRNGQPLVAEVPAPSSERGRVLVANVASVISSGTERAAVSEGGGSLPMRAVRNPDLVALTLRHAREHGIRETVELVRGAVSDDTVLGYASAGTVLDTGGLGDFTVGQAVACAGAGRANHAEVVSVPGNLVAPVPAGVALRDAAFTTLGAIAMQGMRRAEAALGERIVVVGLGLLGLLSVQILRAAGCAVLGVEPDASRRDLGVRLGAERALAPDGAVGDVRAWTCGMGADTVIVTAAAASSAIVNDAVAMTRRKGRVVPLGDVGLAFDRAPLYQREADVLISTSYGPGRYDPIYEDAGVDYPPAYVRWTENRNMGEFLRLLAARQVVVEPLVGLELPVERAHEAYAALRSQQPPPLAAVLRYPGLGGDAVASASESVRVKPAPRRARAGGARGGGASGGGSRPGESRQVRVGVVGPGAFVRAVHLPNLRADGAAPLVAVAARRGTVATDVARAAGGEVDAVTDWRRVVEHADVDLVLIGTRHDSHAEIAAAALRSGKAVLVEKPLGLTREQIDDVWEAGEGDGAPLAIGFNRPLAPLSQRMREELAQVDGPLQVVIRVNAPLPAEHWLNDPDQGGGRILGEGCHFLDYANWLCGVPVSVGGAAARERGSVRTVQSASITVSYENGSVASVHYSGLGPAALPKERVEVLAGGRAWVLDDFQRLTSFDGDGSRTVESGHGDKGHAALMAGVLAACRGERPFLPGLRAAYLAQSVALESLHAIGSGATREVPPPGG